MNLIFKRRKSRFGATTMFLAIIISAIVFVECTYVSMVANLDRRLTYSKAVTLEVEHCLSQYDRTLFRTYGIYAFDIDYIDDAVFREVLSANGYEENAILVVSGMDTFGASDLRKAIGMFYSYRSVAILFDSMRDEIISVLEKYDQYGIYSKIQTFLNSAGEPILRGFLNGVSVIAEYADVLSENGDFSSFISDFQSLINMYSHNYPDINDSYERGNLSIAIDSISFISDMFDNSGDIISDYLFHPYCAHYASYNYDSRLEDDTTINGTEFSEFHEGNLNDVECILTGLEGDAANNLTAFMIYQILFVKNLINCYLDSALMATFKSIAAGLSVLFALITEGVLLLPPEVYEIIIAVIYSLSVSGVDLNAVLQGESIAFFSVEELAELKIGYKDLVCYFMNFVPDDFMLSRMLHIFDRDFENYVCGVGLKCTRPLYEIEVERSYDLYA